MDDWHLWTSYFPKNIPLWFDRKILYGDLVKSHPWLQIKLNEKFHLNARMMFQKLPKLIFLFLSLLETNNTSFPRVNDYFDVFAFQNTKYSFSCESMDAWHVYIKLKIAIQSSKWWNSVKRRQKYILAIIQ